MDYSDKSLSEAFEKHFDLGVVKHVEALKKGVANKLYKLETSDGGEYVFKVAIRNTEGNRVLHEVEYLNALDNIPSPKPILTKQGVYTFPFKGYLAFIYPFLPGEPGERLNTEMRRQAGEMLASIHIQSADFSTEVSDGRIRLWDIPGYYSLDTLYASIQKVENESIKEAALYAYEHVEEYYVDTNDLPVGSMHMDFKPENTLYLNGNLSGVVDFDNSYLGPFALDLAYSLLWFGLEGKGLKLANAQEFLNAYQQVRPLSDAEKTSLYSYIHFHCLATILIASHWLFDKHLPLPEESTQWYVDTFLPTHKRLLLQKTEFADMIR